MGKFLKFLKEEQAHQAQMIQNILSADDNGYTLHQYICNEMIESTLEIPTSYINSLNCYTRCNIFRMLLRYQFPTDYRFIEMPELFEDVENLAGVLVTMTDRKVEFPKFIIDGIMKLKYSEMLIIFKWFVDSGHQMPESVQAWLFNFTEDEQANLLLFFIRAYISKVDEYTRKYFYSVFPVTWIRAIGKIKDETQRSIILNRMVEANINLDPTYFGEIKLPMSPAGAYKKYREGDHSEEVLAALARSPKHARDALQYSLLGNKSFTVYPILLDAVRSDSSNHEAFIRDMAYEYHYSYSELDKPRLLEIIVDEIMNHFLVKPTGYKLYQILYMCKDYNIPLFDEVMDKALSIDLAEYTDYIPDILDLFMETEYIDKFPDKLFEFLHTDYAAQRCAYKYIYYQRPIPKKLLEVYTGLLEKNIGSDESDANAEQLANRMLSRMSQGDIRSGTDPKDFLNQDILNSITKNIKNPYYINSLIQSITNYNQKPGVIGKLELPEEMLNNLKENPVAYLTYRLSTGDFDYSLNDVIPLMDSSKGDDAFSKYYVFDKFPIAVLKSHESDMSESFKKYYFYPRIKAEKYNHYYDGIFIHATGDVNGTLKLYKDTGKNPADVCVSTIRTDSVFRSPAESEYNVLLIGYGDIRLLFDFDAYTNRDPVGRRYATSSFEEEEEEPTDFHKKVSDKWKKFGEERSRYGDYNPAMHMDEGIMDLKTCELYLIVANGKRTIRDIRKILGRQDVKIISFEKYQEIRSSERLMHFLEILKTQRNDRNLHNQPFHKYEEMMNATPFRDFLLNEGKINLDMDRAYELFSAEYMAATGQTWSRDKFMSRAANWDFYGDENGFVAVRNQKSGFVKLVGMAGSGKSKYKGFKELVNMGVPLWGMVSKDIAQMALKMGMRVPNWLERNILKKAIDPAVFGGTTILGYTNDGGIEFEYSDLGKVTKYFIGTPAYYKKAALMFKDLAVKKIGL